MASFEQLLSKSLIFPVVVIDDFRKAADLGRALVDSGLPIAEVTLRTPESWQAIEEMLKVDKLEVGVGSIKSGEDIQRAHSLGASFAVSPGFTDELALHAKSLNLAYIPGVSTPSEIMSALSNGFTLLKWFPAESLGGVSALRSIAAPFPGVRFIPTGGITLENIRDYLALDFVAAVGGSWMVPREALKMGDFAAIKADTENALSVVRSLR